MKSVTIHGVEDRLVERIDELARSRRTSRNRTIKTVLEAALLDDQGSRREAFLDLFGTWSDAEARQFDEAVEEFSRVDPEDWEA